MARLLELFKSMTLKNISQTRRIIFIVLASSILVVLVSLGLMAFQEFQNQQDKPLIQNNGPITNLKEGSGTPKRIRIPTIGVDAPVIYVGLTNKGIVDSPKGPDEVGWFGLGPRPGDKGSATMVGHFGRWQTGSDSVFDNLTKLSKGDKIYVKNDKGEEISFRVTGSRIYDFKDSAPEVFNKNDGTYLNLITCNGDWIPAQKTYTKRLVVFTEAII